MGKVAIEVPRDRNGEFEPKILPKNQTSISQDMENKIISMYAKGMSTSDIEDHIRDIYGLEISDTTVSRITDKVLPVAKEWQHCVGDFFGIFILVNERRKAVDLKRLRLFVRDNGFKLLYSCFKSRLLIVVLLHDLLVLPFGNQA